MDKKIFTSGFVDYQFQIYVSETNKIEIWIHECICTAVMLEMGSVSKMIKPFQFDPAETITDIAQEVAMSLLFEYYEEAVTDQIRQQSKK